MGHSLDSSGSLALNANRTTSDGYISKCFNCLNDRFPPGPRYRFFVVPRLDGVDRRECLGKDDEANESSVPAIAKKARSHCGLKSHGTGLALDAAHAGARKMLLPGETARCVLG